MSEGSAKKKAKEITPEQIRELIEESGYTLEIDVLETLREHGWYAFSQYPYFDKGRSKIRRLDVFGVKPIISRLNALALIECKKSTQHAWAFYSFGKMGEPQFSFPLLHEFSRLKESIPPIEASFHGKIVPMNDFHVANPQTKVATLCCIPKGQKDDFHQASLQVVNALEWMRQEQPGQVFFPVIVFDGSMVEFHQGNGKLDISNTDYLQYLSAFPDEQSNKIFPCFIDVVKNSYFSNFLQLVEGSIDWFRKLAKESGMID